MRTIISTITRLGSMLLALGSFSSCQSLEPAEVEAQHSGYYPIHTFFRHEADSLQHHHATVTKTVGEGAQQETKTLPVKDWDVELGAFLSIDFSKPAYAGQYAVDSTAQQIVYTALSDEVDIQYLKILLDANGDVQEVEVFRQEDNLLYQNAEKLFYLRGKEYRMDKQQHILLLGESQYQIVGLFSDKK